MAPADASALVLAADAQGRLVLATLASENELSASSTAVALLWMWIKPVAGSALDDKSLASKARGAAGFDLLVTQIDAALAAGMSPIDSLPVLATLDDVTAALGEFVEPQSGRISPLAEIARHRLAASAQLLARDGSSSVNLISGNLFVNDTENISIFNGTALYWSAYAQAYDGKRVALPELLSPVAFADAIRYGNGVAPLGGYSTVLGHPSVSYDLVVVQDLAAQRANAVMLMRTVLQALLGTTALAFGDVSCLNNFIVSVAPAELDALAAKGGADALQAYMSSFNRGLANLSLKNLTVSASCGGGETLLRTLTKAVPQIQIALSAYSDGFAKVGKAKKSGEAISTWYEVAFDTFYADRAELKLGICVAGGQVVQCATRYALTDNRPWLEGARATLPLVAFAGDKGDKPTLVPSTLAISSQNILPLTAGPDTVVQVLSADFTTTLRIRDEPTGHDSSTVSLIVEPGKIKYVSLLGSATSGPFTVGQGRALAVLSSSDASQFYGDVAFDWRVAPGFEDIVELNVGGPRLASIKALKPGIAVIYAINSVTGRRLEFPVGVDFLTGHWAGNFKADECPLGLPYPYVYLWEKPCYTLGNFRPFYGYLAQNTFSSNSASFYFSDNGNQIIFQQDNIRSSVNAQWRSADSTLQIEFPTRFRMALPIGQRMISYDGLRKMTLKVESRTPIRIGGTFTVESTSLYGDGIYPLLYPQAYNQAVEDSIRVVPSVTTGTWSASYVQSPMPDLQLNGNFVCVTYGPGKDVAYKYPEVYEGAFQQLFTTGLYYWDNLKIGDISYTNGCSWGD